MTIKTWDQAETGLAKVWPGFQSRPQQRQMGLAVQQTISGNSRHRVRLVQAGCGVGKSVGYLIPAIASGGRTVIAVSTKALQEQLFNKDLPTLRDTLFPDLTFAMLKGRSNYVCLRAAARSSSPCAVAPGSAGERSDLLVPVDDAGWREISTDADGCVGRNACPFSDECFSEKARREALAARVLIVNTSLLTQDLRFRGMTRGKASLLGDFDTMIVDEAHEMADIVADGLSTRLTLRRITDCLAKLTYHLDSPSAPAWVEQMNSLSSSYFNGARAWFEQQKGEVRTAELSEDDHKALGAMVDALAPLLGEVARARCSCEPIFDPETGQDTTACEFARRTDSLMSDLSKFCDPDSTADVVWMERDNRGSVVLRTSPAEVGGFLNAVAWNPAYLDEPCRTILCSATLGVGGDFTYTARRLGLSAYDGLDVGTPFDYNRQARLYLPPASAPSPSKQREEWKPWASDQMSELIDAAGGGALLLFTSTSAMREAHDRLARGLAHSGMTPMLQSNGVDNRDLARQFTADTHSVLFATRSFMTGVDFAGDTCRLVVIDKMPFPVPDEPVFKARCAATVQRFGPGSDFRRVSIPEMSLVLVQAFGRLIRTVSDRGVVAILDPRMRAGWAATIRRSLPPAPVVGSIDEVRDFYAQLTLSAF